MVVEGKDQSLSLRRKLYTHVHLDYIRIEFLSCINIYIYIYRERERERALTKVAMLDEQLCHACTMHGSLIKVQSHSKHHILLKLKDLHK